MSGGNGNNRDPQPLSGLVIKAQSGFFTVETVEGPIVAQIPGRLKQERLNTDIVAVGDRVTVSRTEGEKGVIESVAPRTRVLSRARPAPNARQVLQDREQVVVANLDQVIFVLSIRQPSPSLRKLDRFLVVAELNQLLAVVCVNKVDLVKPGAAEEIFGDYERIGYPVLYASALRGDGVPELRTLLHERISVLAGSSGVGKSSLLNAVEPGLGLRIGEVSHATGKGLHTTRHVELVPLVEGGYVADTPGIRSLALFDIEPWELDGYFREIAPLVSECYFNDCSHQHERGCAVRAAVERGDVSAARYDSFLRLREEQQALHDGAYD